MKQEHYDKVRRINSLTSDMDALYHQAALRLGISDSVLSIMYILHDRGDGCPIYDICSASRLSKQTINSALRKLEGDGMIYLEPQEGKQSLCALRKRAKRI